MFDELNTLIVSAWPAILQENEELLSTSSASSSVEVFKLSARTNTEFCQKPRLAKLYAVVNDELRDSNK